MKVSAAISVLRTEKGRPEVPGQPGLQGMSSVVGGLLSTVPHPLCVPLQLRLKKDELGVTGWALAGEMD